MKTSVFGLVLLVLCGCASGGGGGGDDTVPVFLTPADVPCEYVVMDTIQERSSVSVPSPSQGRESARNRERVLGRAGARLGADAVVVIPFERLPFRVAVSRGESQMVPVTYEGEAVRYSDPTCGAAAKSRAPSGQNAASAPA